MKKVAMLPILERVYNNEQLTDMISAQRHDPEADAQPLPDDWSYTELDSKRST